ncbi:hypothetical protein QJS10_CPA05g00883 [Acorus calamus]|uniref:Uncharacterized protein n=1 Tax=Acorus calamus TaxID=4465 RepID=A0AAV9EUI3_ACOCL|nr:hypothetical protein QJS10_CPA05g00883 [Acorus calamus]
MKEMSASPSETVRIALECPKERSSSTLLLREEPVWTMYCNGRRMGCAVARACGEKDWRLLRTLKAVSVGAGIVPLEERRSIVDGGGEGMGKRGMEVMYMRAKFERVVGKRSIYHQQHWRRYIRLSRDRCPTHEWNEEEVMPRKTWSRGRTEEDDWEERDFVEKEKKRVMK